MAPKVNVVKSVIDSQLGLHRSPYRQSLKLLNSLVKNPKSSFEKIWCETSKQPIVYDDGKIYFNNHTHCMALCGKDSLPSTFYRLQKNTRVKRFEDTLIYSGPVSCTPLPREDFKPYFLAVTSDNWLIRYDNITGKTLQEIYLGPDSKYKFNNVDWETQGETICLQSTLFPAINNRNPNRKLRVVQAVAIFQIFPLKFVGMFEIDQTVFGKEVNSANISEGLLIIGIGSSKSAKIRIYNLREILTEKNRLFNATLDTKCDDLGGKVGQYPFGLPLNYKISQLPPVIFEVKCSEQNLHFGGYPWHFVINPLNTMGVFEVRNVATNELSLDGRLDVPNATTISDTLTFHSDNTGRLVYESGNYIKFYKLTAEQNNRVAMKEQFEFMLNPTEKIANGNTKPVVTSTARVNGQRAASKNVCYIERTERQILATDFENELEFYLILGIDNQSNKKNNGILVLYDNESGEKVKEFRLPLTLDEMADYNIVMDLDTIVITTKLINKFECHIYRLTRDLDIQSLNNGEDKCDDETPTTQTPKKRRKKNRKCY